MVLNDRRGTCLGNLLEKYRSSAMDRILPNLYLGGYSASQDVNLLFVNNIKHIVCCLDSELEASYNEDISVLRIQVADSIATNIAEHFKNAINFIHSARSRGEGVLVHCFAGVSRSATIVAAYLITVTDLDFLSALGFLTSRRRIANPNTGFRMQLCKYSKEDLAAKRAALKGLIGTDSFDKLLEADLMVTNTADLRRNSISSDSTA